MTRAAAGTLDDLVATLRPGMNVFVPGTSGESLGFYAALKRRPEMAAGVRFVCVHFPGMNESDFTALHPEASQRAYFAQPHLRSAMQEGRVDLMPLDYPGIWRDLQSLRIDLAVAHVSPPDRSRRMSLGNCYDFLPAVWARAGMRAAHVNPALPRTAGSFSIDANECDILCSEEAPVVTRLSGEPGAELTEIGRQVAALVHDGDTLQLGIGKMQSAVVRALRSHRRLRLHSGMVTEEIVNLVDAHAIRGPGSIVAGVALGDEGFYRRLGEDATFTFCSVQETHDVDRIARIPGFVAINAALEVDLFGQVNSDCLDGQLQAGVGGMPPFVAGAARSPGGCAIFCLSATAAKGTVSRIVPKLSAGSAVGVPRHAVDTVVTEYGVAQIGSLPVHRRAERLIELAAPTFRTSLAQEWAHLKARL
jgi:acyl-CoA hydrolase